MRPQDALDMLKKGVDKAPVPLEEHKAYAMAYSIVTDHISKTTADPNAPKVPGAPGQTGPTAGVPTSDNARPAKPGATKATKPKK